MEQESDHNLRLRMGQISPKPINTRSYSDREVRARILELRARGHTARQVASILNEQGVDSAQRGSSSQRGGFTDSCGRFRQRKC